MPDDSAETAAHEQQKYKEHLEMLKERLGPHLSEHFDGYVLMGYSATEAGSRRVILYDDGKSIVMADALRGPLILASKWSQGQL